MIKPPPAPQNTPVNVQPSTGLKMLGIGALALILLVPIAFVNSTLGERKQRRDEATKDITSSWGSGQSVVGPVLIIPYQYRYKATKSVEVNGKMRQREVIETAVANAFFLPASLEIDGDTTPKKLHRGIFEAVVYTGQLGISGLFPKPDWQALKIDTNDVIWKDAVIAFAIPDLRGAKGALKLALGDRSFTLLPGTKLPGFTSGVHAVVGAASMFDHETRFSLDLDLNGSASLSFAPLGVRTIVKLRSPWKDPKFMGNFLPAKREVSSSGFEAIWDVSYYGRNYPQQSTSRDSDQPTSALLTPTFFGVSFLSQVDSYRNVERSAKYAILFITIVFAAFFLFEVLAGLKIHPLQYALVGLELCMFFLVLLSLSEFIAFGWAYLSAAALATVMIALYSATFLKGGKRTAVLALEMSGIYAYLYVVLQLQDYSLLMGSVLLTFVLGAIMYTTRHVDWYSIDAALRSSDKTGQK